MCQAASKHTKEKESDIYSTRTNIKHFYIKMFLNIIHYYSFK